MHSQKEKPTSPTRKTKVSQKPAPFIDRGPELPKTYGDTKIILLVRDPRWVYSYWEIGKKVKQDLKKYAPFQAVIRLYDVTGLKEGFHSTNDIQIDLDASNWYFQIPKSGRNYYAELGLIKKDGKFFSIASSNRISVPFGQTSDLTDEKWLIVRKKFERLIKQAGLDQAGLSSHTIMGMLISRLEGMLSISSPKGASKFKKSPKK